MESLNPRPEVFDPSPGRTSESRIGRSALGRRVLGHGGEDSKGTLTRRQRGVEAGRQRGVNSVCW